MMSFFVAAPGLLIVVDDVLMAPLEPGFIKEKLDFFSLSLISSDLVFFLQLVSLGGRDRFLFWLPTSAVETGLLAIPDIRTPVRATATTQQKKPGVQVVKLCKNHVKV